MIDGDVPAGEVGDGMASISARPTETVDPALHDGSIDPSQIPSHWLVAGDLEPEPLPAADDDLSAAHHLINQRLQRLLGDDATTEVVGHVLDGAYRGERDALLQSTLDSALVGVAERGLVFDVVPAETGMPEMAEIGETLLPDGVDAAIVFPTDADPAIIVAADLGLRDVLLAVQDGAVNVLFNEIELLGIGPLRPSAVSELRTLIDEGSLPQANPNDVHALDDGVTGEDRGPLVSVAYRGRILEGEML